MDAAATGRFWDTENQEPYDYYERVRAAGDIVWDAELKCWLVPSFEVGRQILQDDSRFVHPYMTMKAGETYLKVRANNPRSSAFMHGETHRAFHRWWVTDLLSPKRVEVYRKTIIAPVLARILDRLDGRNRFDLVDDVAERIPVGVFSAVLELPRQDEETLTYIKGLSDDFSRFASVANSLKLEDAPSAEDQAIASRAVDAAGKINDLLRPLVRERRAGTGSDFISRLWAGGPKIFDDWNEVDTLDSATRFMTQGVDTTTHAISNAFHMLLTDPELMQLLRSGDSGTVDRFVEEVFRLNGSVQFRPRRVAADTQVAGVDLKKGDMVVVLLMAANRDPAQYACPHAVRFDRPVPRNHNAFSYGPRVCAGASLARAELAGAISAVLARYPRLRLDPEAAPPTFKGFLMRSYRPLHVIAD